MNRRATKRATQHLNKYKFKKNRRATKRATQHINKDEFRMNCHAAKRATSTSTKLTLKWIKTRVERSATTSHAREHAGREAAGARARAGARPRRAGGVLTGEGPWRGEARAGGGCHTRF
jgi:hypothetical protein